METAVLRLGLAGFTAGEERAIRDLAARDHNVDWIVGGTDGADAWLVNGPRVASMHGSVMRVMCTDGAGRVAPIVIDGASRPTAFAMPLAQPVPSRLHHQFDLKRPATLGLVLASFGRDLHGAKLCFWTAGRILEHHTTVGKGLFELRSGDELLAVVDMKGDVAVSQSASQDAFARAEWKHRARKAVMIPGSFQRSSLAELLWRYTTRTRRDLLPERYRESAIFFRRPPRVDARLIADAHLLISRELAVGPLSIGELEDATKLDREVIERALADFYFVGSITSNPERAWRGSVRSGPWSSNIGLLEAGSKPGSLRGEATHTTAPLL